MSAQLVMASATSCPKTDKHELWMYGVAKDDYISLRQCPYRNTSLAVINNLITAVGGQKGEYGTPDYEFSNHLYSYSNR